MSKPATMPPEWTPAVEQTWTRMVAGTDGEDPGASLRPRTEVITTELPDDEAASFGPRSLEAQATAAERPAARHRRIAIARPAGADETSTGNAEDGDDPSITNELRLEDRIGVGAMGEVYAASQRSLARVVAIKLMRESHGADGAAMRQFESEAIIAGQLDHPNIVPVHDLGVDGQGRLVYFMKRVEGTAWSRLLRASAGEGEAHVSMTGRAMGSRSGRGTHSLRDHIEVLLAVCDAVAFAHSRGYVHRDIKPDNVIVGAYGEVQLIDWGLAAALPVRTPEQQAPPPEVSTLATAMITCGTPSYMPPETSLGLRHQVGAASDVYTLAAILYEILYGRRLHRGKTVMDVVRAAGRNAWTFPEVVREQALPFHAALAPLLERALATDPGRRPPDGASFAVALREHLDRIDATAAATRAHRSLMGLRADRHDPGDTLIADDPKTPEQRYRAVSRIIARLEESLDQWSGNPDARAWLAEAHLMQAKAAVQAGDFIGASATLEDVRALPGTARLPADVLARADGMREQVAERLRIRERRQRFNRGLRLVALILSTVLLGMIAAADVLMRRARDRAQLERDVMSRTLLTELGDGLQGGLQAQLAPPESAVRIGLEWARRGELDGFEPARLDGLLMPTLRGLPLVTSAIVADTKGYEYMVLSEADGWRTRETRPGARPVWRRYGREGTLLETIPGTEDYDPTARPWFAEARALFSADEEPTTPALRWTAPYRLHTTEQPGMSVVGVARSPNGRELIVVFDLTLEDLSRLTTGALARERGSVFLTDDRGRALGLPAGRFDDRDALAAAVFTPIDALDLPLETAVWNAWNDRGRVTDDVFDLEFDAQRYWAGAFALEVPGAEPLRAFAVVPESGFAE